MTPAARAARSHESEQDIDGSEQDVAPPRARRASARGRAICTVAALLCFAAAVLAGGQARPALGIVAAVLAFAVIQMGMRPEDRDMSGAGGHFLRGGDDGDVG